MSGLTPEEDAAYEEIDRYIRNTTSDVVYAHYSQSLDILANRTPATVTLLEEWRVATKDGDAKGASWLYEEAAALVKQYDRFCPNLAPHRVVRLAYVEVTP